MRVVVTGGAGFIGSNFVRFLLEQGHQVITIDALTYAGNLENLGEYQFHPAHTFYKETICSKSALQHIFYKHLPNIIIHMAAESHVDRSIDSPDAFIQTNVVGTHAVLSAALSYYKEHTPDGFRLLHISTDEVFGALGQTGYFVETMPYRPNSPYAASKASADHLVRAYFRTYGLPMLIAHPSNTYGPRQYPEKLIPLMIAHALQEKKLPLYGDGLQVRDWLYVQDTVSALYALIQQGILGESYCISSCNETTNKDVVQRLCSLLDELQPRSSGASYQDLIMFVKDRPGHDFRYASDASKLQNQTGWRPSVGLQQGLQATVQWYLQQYKHAQYQNSTLQRIGLG